MIGFPKLFAFFCFFQSRQPVFVRLLRGAFRLSQCSWMSGSQKYHVETCIKTLSDVGECESLSVTPPTFNSQDIISNSSYCLPYNSYDVNLENLILDQLIIP